MEHILYQVGPDLQRNADPGLSEKVDPMSKITLFLKNSYLIKSTVLILNMTVAFLKLEPKDTLKGVFWSKNRSFCFVLYVFLHLGKFKCVDFKYDKTPKLTIFDARFQIFIIFAQFSSSTNLRM